MTAMKNKRLESEEKVTRWLSLNEEKGKGSWWYLVQLIAIGAWIIYMILFVGGWIPLLV